MKKNSFTYLLICCLYFVQAPSCHANAEYEIQKLYLNLMKKCLTNTIYDDDVINRQHRNNGLDFPSKAHTMIGLKRLNNLQFCIEDVILRGIPGDLIETGVWRGGATIFMRACLKAYGDTTRRVWVADSFDGLPPPNPALFPADEGLNMHEMRNLAIPIEQVQKNFAKYGLLDNQVVFLKGFFADTLPTAPIETIAVLRLDGDLYESTMEALMCLYSKVSVGGYVIVDDFGAIPACAKAVMDFRAQYDITDPIHQIDWTGVYWRKTKP